MTSWFPRPEHITDVQLLTPGAYPIAHFYALLKAPQAQEWRDRVGVYGLREGSGKTTTRLLCHQDWVFKTDHSQATQSYLRLQQAHQQHQEQAQALGIYHPHKQWLLLQAEAHWWPLTACPRLETLRARNNLASRLAGWVAMYRIGARVLRDHGLELDLNPANFASDPGGTTLWYLDDEWYTGQSDLSALGTSLAHRMAESEDLSLNDWYSLGTGVHQALRELNCSPQALRSLQDSLNEYPLRGAAREARASFLRPLARRSVSLRKETTHHIGMRADV